MFWVLVTSFHLETSDEKLLAEGGRSYRDTKGVGLRIRAFFVLSGSRERKFNSIYAKILYRYFHKYLKMWYTSFSMHIM
jgi:hypothetical protein